MIYAKIDVLLPRHHRIQAIDRASALGVYVSMLCCTRELELDGFVPLTALRGFPSHSKKDVEDLARVGLITPGCRDTVPGFFIDRYAQKNETKEEIAARRAATNARVTKHRNGVTNNKVTERVSALVPGSDSVFGSGSDPEKEMVVGDVPPEQAYQRAYEAGISEGLANGAGYAMPENHRGALHQAILAHSNKRRGDKLIEWIQAAAADFAEDMRGRPDEQKFYSALGPRGWLRWLNEEAAKVEARAIP